MADSIFKNLIISFPAGWTAKTSGKIIGAHQYRPDRSFADETGTIVCVLESSSTNDRKVGVGELCLANKFFADTKVRGCLIFSLCSKSKSPPTPMSQASYIKPYFEHLCRASADFGVKELYFINECDFELVGWIALCEEFLSKAVALKA